MKVFLLKLWRLGFGDTVERIEAEAEAYRNSPAGKRIDWKTILVLLFTALQLTGREYGRFSLNGLGLFPDDTTDLVRHLSWAVGIVFWYVAPSLLLIVFGFRERPRDYGLKLAGWTSGWKIYLVFIAVMVPLVTIFSAEPHFKDYYPFYRDWTPEAGYGKLVVWELAYALQFVALEFFLRGFVLHGLKHRFGIYAVFAMTVPYCMIHFTKPLPETLASIIAGVALGFMSLKTKSVWLGAALHISVAWGMDSASLYRKGLLF